VTKIERKAAWVDLEEGLQGRAAISELSWAHPKADPSRFLEVDKQYDFIVLGDNSRPRSTIELSLKRLRSDPWTQELILSLQEQGVITGRVWGHARFGLFIEIAPEVVGLIHESKLPESMREQAVDIFPRDARIKVRIDEFDIEARRIALSLADPV